ncbi:MAG: hypothetical protein ACFFBD_00490 [Candidatus Hodarchaeota archaeon]
MVRVLVVGCRGTVPVSVIKSLKLVGGYEIHSADSNRYAPALYLVKKRHLLPKYYENSYIDKLEDVIQKEKIEAVIPCSDILMHSIIEDFFKIDATIIAPEKEAVQTCLDKLAVYEFFDDHKIPCAETVLPENADEIVKSKGFPIVVKRRFGSMKLGFAICHNETELKVALDTNEECPSKNI